MGVVMVEPNLPMPGIPDLAIIEKARRGMAGCGSCQGMGDYTGTGEEFSGGGGAPAGGGYVGSGGFIQDITKGTLAILGSVFAPPSYRQATTPTGSLTEVRIPGYTGAYPGSREIPQPAPSGISTTTLLLIGVGIFALMNMRGR